MLPSRCYRCGAVSREPLCASCVDFLVAYRPFWLDPSLLPGPSLLDLLAPREVAVLSAEGEAIEWRSTAHDPTADDAVRLIGLLGLESAGNPVVSAGDADVLHAFLAEARRSPPQDPVQRSALAALYDYLAAREWIPPHLSGEYRLRAKTLRPAPPVEPETPAAVTRAETEPPAVPEELPAEPAVEAPVEPEPPLPEPIPEPEPPIPLPEPEPRPTPEPEPEPEPEEAAPEPAAPAPPPAPPQPSEVMAVLSEELREMKEELHGEIAKERESVQAWLHERAGEMEAREKGLQEQERALGAEAKAVEAARASVTQRLQEVEKDEARLAVLKFLDTVPGMTEPLAQTLVTVFPDMSSLRSADARALTQCRGVTETLAKAIRFELVPGEVEDEQRAIDLREEAQSFLEEGDHRAALECYDRLLAEHPEDKVFWFDKAEIHMLLEEPEEALQCYTRVLDLDRRDRQAWFERANLLFGMGRLADAVDALREAIRVEPRRSGDILLKAEQLRRDGHANEAAILYQAILDVDPGNGRAVLGLGDTFLDLGDHDAAEGLFSRALGKEGKDPELLFRKGELLNRKGRWGAAIQFYNRALALKWELAPAWLAKGETLLAHDRAQEALECFEKVLSLDPENEDARKGKREAGAFLRPVRPPAPPAPRPSETPPEEPPAAEPSADEEIDRLLDSVEPSFAEALREAVGEKKEEGKPVDQVPADFKSFIESVEPEKEDTHVLIQLAELALEGGDADMALLRYEQALDQDPKSAAAWTGKGTALQQLERYEEALAAYDRALELHPGDELAARWRETCLRHLRRSGSP